MTVSGDLAVVRLQQVSVRFGSTVAAQDLSFTVARGERVAILGRTGAGKSTLLNLLIGNLSPTEGSVHVDSADPYLEHKKLQGLIGMAFQTPSLLPWLTALDNAAVGLKIIGGNKKESRERAMEWLAKVNLAHAADRYPSQLSGGMRQRVSLARAFAIEPKLVLLDESFSALDEVTANQLRNDFIKLSDDTNATAIIVTHSIEEAFVLGHRVLVFDSPAQIVGEYDTLKYPVGSEQFAGVRQEIHELMRGRNPSTSPGRTKTDVAISSAGLSTYSREAGAQ
jgi:NitT/TauT family transport system ATP-binding protein